MTVRIRWWLLNNYGTGDGRRHAQQSTGSPAPPTFTFHLLTETGDALLTEAGAFIEIEHV